MTAALARLRRNVSRLARPFLVRLAYLVHRTDPSLAATATRRPVGPDATIVVLDRTLAHLR